jgi:glycolate oxidase iron-sulfur subunit
MQTELAAFIRDTPEGKEADAILRKCVHCGFCTATCPTYQLLGDELDGPRGRIYLIKQVLEGAAPTEKTRLHLDRCLTCRACETTCPSGVQYGRLADIGRAIVEEKVGRGPWESLQRSVLAWVLPRTVLFTFFILMGRVFRPFLPTFLKTKIPQVQCPGAWPDPRHEKKMLALAGCVQPALAPRINAAAARVLDRQGVSLVEARGAGCCGALRFHLNDQAAGRADARALIDAWWPAIERGDVEAIAMTASGCGAFVREYDHLLKDDPNYAQKAARVSALTRDLCEVVSETAIQKTNSDSRRVAFQSPCSLQHGQQLRGKVERLLQAAGYELSPVAEGHLCCGSAGTYSILQPELSTQLRERKLRALAAGDPAVVATANIGCLSHLQGGTATPIRHWIELLE